MIDFIHQLLTASDYHDLLGDMYEPVVGCLVVCIPLISLGATASAFVEVIRCMFRSNK